MIRSPRQAGCRGGCEALTLTEVPVPDVATGSVLIRVHAFGLNRSELHLRQGVAGNATFPRIPGIEAAGVVASAPGGELAEGTQVAAMMGGMGREFDGGFAEYVTLPAQQVIPFRSELDWATIGAVREIHPESLGGAVELVCTNTLPDTLRATRPGGTA